jgi:uncharacterized GH25 family protein
VPLVEDRELPPALLPPASPMEVRTVGPDGRPVAGIEVRTLDPFGESRRFQGFDAWRWRIAAARSITDAQGRASLQSFKFSVPAVVAASPRFLGQAATGKPGEAVTLRLSPGRAGWIEAWDAGGKPVPGALARWKGEPVGITGADGRLEIAMPEGGDALTLESREGWGARVTQAEGKGILPVRLARPRRIAGRVVDALSRKPVAGALVWSGWPLVAPAVRSGADGAFVLEVPAAEGWVEAGAAGFLRNERQLVKKGPEPAVLTLAPSAALSGIVVDSRGQPVSGVNVTLSYMKGTEGLSVPARSRADGEFRFTGLPPGGTFDLSATRDGFARTTATARTAPAGQPSPRARIVMADGQTAFGRVVDEGGRPIEGAALLLASPYGEGLRDAVSDAEGRFEFRHLIPGRVSLRATHPDHAPGFLKAVEIPPETPRVNLGTVKLPPAEAIEGRVTDSRGRAIEGAEVLSYGETSGFGGDSMAMLDEEAPLRTGSDGSFRIERLESGKRYALTVRHAGYVEASVPGVPAPTLEPLTIELKAARSLSGRVLGPEGEPVEGATVFWFQDGNVSFDSAVKSDADGKFRITGFPPGTLMLEAMAEGYANRRIEGIEIPGDKDPEDLQITLQRAITLDVRVLNAEGEPVPGVSVSMQPVEPIPVEDRRMVLLHGLDPDRTDAAGRCRLTVPNPGNYWVLASRQGEPVRNQVEVHEGSNAVEIRLPAITEISGRVVDGNGAPVARAAVNLRQNEALQRRWTSADGTFVFSDVADGEYRVAAVQEKLASEEVGVTVAGRPVQGIELRLDRERPGATLTGHVLGLPPEELSGLLVRAFGQSEMANPVPADREGAYRFERLTPGTWRIEAMDSRQREALGTVEIPPGIPAVEFDLKFPTGFTLTGRVLVDGVPLSEAIVRAQGKEGFDPNGRTAYDGTFELRDLPAGLTTLVVSGPQGLGAVRTLMLTESQDIKIELATGRLAGTVVSATGEPVEDALIRLEAWSTGVESSFAQSVARTSADGAFQFPRIAAGTYKIKVSKDGFAPVETTAEVPPGGGGPPMSVLLKPQGGVQ